MDITKKTDFVNKTNISRRGFLENSIKGIGAIAAGSAMAAILNACGTNSNPTSPSNNGGGSPVTIDISTSPYTALQSVGGTTATSGNSLDPNGLLLYRQSQTVVEAYSRTCTHQACQVGAFQSGVSTCPCHGSQYNTSGNVVRGPAPSALHSYTTKLDGNTLTVS